MEYDLEIQALEDQLEQAIIRQGRLIREIGNDVELVIKKPLQNQLPIPEDILVIIFSYLVFPNPQQIGRLLFVCRHWYSIIVNTPILWSVIHVNIRENDQDPLLWTAYSRSCIQRSGASPLDITINCQAKYYPSEIIRYALCPFWRDFGMVYPYSLIRSIVKSFLVSCYTSKYFERCDAPLRILMGPNGVETTRWRSLRLGDGRWACRFLVLLSRRLGMRCGRPPYKEGIGRIVCHFPEQQDRMGVEKRGSTCTRIPSNMPSLRYLDIPLIRQLKSIHPLIIQEVDIFLLQLRYVNHVLRIRHLRRLSIGMDPHRIPEIAQDISLNKGDVCFPHLVELISKSWLPPSFWEYLDAPQLETLTIKEDADIPNEVAILPRVARIKLEGSFISDRDMVYLPDLVSFCPQISVIHCRREIVVDSSGM